MLCVEMYQLVDSQLASEISSTGIYMYIKVFQVCPRPESAMAASGGNLFFSCILLLAAID